MRSLPCFCTTDFRDAESFDTRANGLQRAVDGFGLLVGGNRLLGIVDLEREVRSALEIESPLQRNAANWSRRWSVPSGCRSRRVTLRGNRNQTDTRQRPMMVSTRYFRGIRLREEGGWLSVELHKSL